MVQSSEEIIFYADLEAIGLPKPTKELAFASPIRRWKADYAFPDIGLLIEIEGGVYTNGRHITPLGFQEDMWKYNAATIMGWSLMRFTPSQMKSGVAARWIKFYFDHNGSRKTRNPGELSEKSRHTIANCSNEIQRARKRQKAGKSRKHRMVTRFKIK